MARAEICGMKVNAAKTKTILISELKAYLPEAHFFDTEGAKIEAGDEIMNVLGFKFSSLPDMSAQVSDIKRKFRTRMWILRHLAHCGLGPNDLLPVYKSVILPCHDYCSVVYHSSLTATQSEALEKLQSRAWKCIFGYELSYRALLEISGCTTLRERREKRCFKFAVKTAASERFRAWYQNTKKHAYISRTICKN